MRITTQILISCFGLMVSVASAQAAPPSITGTSPTGLMIGKTTELTIQGANLAGTPEILSPLPFTYEKVENKDAAKWTVKITLPANAPLGVFPLRLATSKGVSNPVLIAIDQVPTIPEIEPNTKFEQAQAVASPSVVEGATANNDVDHFKFSGSKGQRVIIDAAAARIGSPLDPTIRLTTSSKKFVESSDDTPGLATDARIIATLPESGDYVIEISDTNYKGTGKANYRLTIGSLPMAEEVFPIVLAPDVTNAVELRGGTIAPDKNVVRLAAVPKTLDPYNLLILDIPATAIGSNSSIFEATARIQWPYKLIGSEVPQVIESDKVSDKNPSAPVAFLGRIEAAGDEDSFDLAVDAGAKYRVRVEAGRIGSALDGVLRVLGADGKQIATGDDSPITIPNPPANAPKLTQPDPELEFTVPAGQTKVSLVLADISRRGGLGYHYRIFVEKSVPEFSLAFPVAQSSLHKSQNVLVQVVADRAKGYAGPIRLELVNPPAGLKYRPGLIPAGSTTGAISINLDANTAFPPQFLKIVGKGDGGVNATALSEITFASQGPLPVNVLGQDGFLASAAEPAPVGIDVAETAFEVVHGFEGTVPLKFARAAGGEPALELTLVNPPKGLTIAANKVAEKAADFNVVLKSTVETPLGEHLLALNAKGKLAGADQTVDAPLVKINVVAPIALDGVPKEVSVKPTQTIEIKAKLARKPSAKTEVTLTVDGLPAGVKAEPVKVAPDAADFVIKLVADAGAKAGMGNATIKAAFKAGDKDYPPVTAPVVVKIVP